MFVCVLNKNKKPLHPCHPARARKLLKQGKAVIHRKYPMVIRLKYLVDDSKNDYDYDLRFDPGSKVTGAAIVKNKYQVIGLMELKHKQNISESLEKRSGLRRGRRNRKTRYRRCKWKEAIRLYQRYKALKKQGKKVKKPTLGKESKKGWIAPSLMARVDQTKNLIIKLKKFIPITSLGMELVKFDMQKIENDSISGKGYQQGTLMGYEIREYLLEKWNRKCSYCNIEGVPLEIEHIHPKSKGGSDRISNLCLACRDCNEEKDNMLLDKWLDKIKKKKNKRHQTIINNIPIVKKQCKDTLKDAAVVNTTRWKLFETLKTFNLSLYTQSGAKTKMQRIQNYLDKEHYFDALCVGEITKPLKVKTNIALIFEAIGRGNRQMARVDKYGFPKGHRERKKTCHGFQTGDMVIANVTKGKKTGTYQGKVSIRHNGYFDINDIFTNAVIQGISYKNCTIIQRNDGWQYSSKII